MDIRIELCVLCLLALTPTGGPSFGKPKDKAAPMLVAANVMSFGAKADGKTDDTAAFQKALDTAAPKGGIVLAPAGTYLIAGSLNVPEGVTLRGVWEAPHRANVAKGTTLLATGGAGDDKGKPLIHLADTACAKGLTILHPNQRADNIIHYPWTILGEGSHISVIDVTLVNSYRAVKINGEQHYIKNVFGCALVVGIAIDGCTDVGRIEDIHFNLHYWTRSGHPSAPAQKDVQKLIDFLKENLVAFRIGRTDWEYMTNCFCIFAKIGYHFIRTEGGDPNAILTQCGSDLGPVCVQVDASQAHSGVSFNNSQFMGTIVNKRENNGPLKFANCGFWPVEETDSFANLDGGGTVTFTGCHFVDWGHKDQNAPCILAKRGSLIVNACDFMADKPKITLEADVETAVITGNRLRGGAQITNNSKGDVQIGLNSEK